MKNKIIQLLWLVILLVALVLVSLLNMYVMSNSKCFVPQARFHTIICNK